MNTKPIDSVAVIMKRGNEIAFHYRKNTKTFPQCWAFAGGSIELNESAVDAAQRELAEETGLNISKNRFKFVSDCYTGGQACSIFEVILNSLEEPQHIEKDKHTGWSWITITEALQLNTMPGIYDILRSNYFNEF